MKCENYGFKNLEIRSTEDIELLRKKYEELLVAYENEVKSTTVLSILLEEINFK